MTASVDIAILCLPAFTLLSSVKIAERCKPSTRGLIGINQVL